MSRDFTGASNSYMNGGQLPDIRTNFTIACWFRPDTVTGSPRLLSRWASGSNQRYLLQLSSSKLLLAILGQDLGGQTVAGATTLTTGSWFHAAGTYEPSTALRVYLNGTQDGVLTTSVKPALAAGVAQRTLGIGDETANNTSLFDGRIAEVGIWSATLSAAEIAALAKGVSPTLVRPGALANYWPIWGVAFPEIDLTGTVNATTPGTVALADHAPVGCPFPVAA